MTRRDAPSGASPAERASLLAPAAKTRFRYGPMGSGPDVPHYPAVAASIDYVLPANFSGDLSLEVTDASGRAVRSYRGGAMAKLEATDQAMRGGRRGGGGASTLPSKAGHNRFSWDYRFAGPEGGGPGPMAAPGKFTLKLTAGGVTSTQTLIVNVDPRLLKDNVTAADLVEQQNFLLKVNASIADARRLAARLEQMLTKTGLKTPPPPGPGEDVGSVKYQHPAQGLWARIVDNSAPYPKPVLINQLSNISRMLNQADQKVGKDAYERFADLEKELAALKAEAEKIAGTTTSSQAQR